MSLTLFIVFKHFHVWLALLSFCGFLLRLVWHRRDSELLKKRWVKILPHIIDTLLLSTGVSMAVFLHYSPINTAWFGYKIVGLCIYIAAGITAFRSPALRTPSALIAICSYIAMLYLAINKLT